MSAYVVEKETIDAVVTGLIRSGGVMSLDKATWLGRNLWSMNVDAVSQRYCLNGNDEETEYRAEVASYTFTMRNEPLPVLVKQMDCLLYQCSEGDVPEREAFKALDKAADMLRPKEPDSKNPWPTKEYRAYNSAPWGLPA